MALCGKDRRTTWCSEGVSYSYTNYHLPLLAYEHRQGFLYESTKHLSTLIYWYPYTDLIPFIYRYSLALGIMYLYGSALFMHLKYSKAVGIIIKALAHCN